MLSPFGFSDRLVRTSVFRLTVEDWLESRREGRRSLYALTTSGRNRFEHAFRRVYAPPPDQWDGNWTLVVLPRSAKGGGRTGLRRELEWEGFGVLAPGLFVHPRANPTSLQEILEAAELKEKVLVLSAKDLSSFEARSLRQFASTCWDLEKLATAYRIFIDRFAPVGKTFKDADSMAPREAFAVRTLLIHAFRRAILHDPLLPGELLPPEWPGHVAYELCRDLYRFTYRQAEAHLVETLGDDKTTFTRAAPYFFERFGGLRT